MDTYLNREFSKDGTQMAKKHLKTFSTSAIREMQPKLLWNFILKQSEMLRGMKQMAII